MFAVISDSYVNVLYQYVIGWINRGIDQKGFLSCHEHMHSHLHADTNIVTLYSKVMDSTLLSLMHFM